MSYLKPLPFFLILLLIAMSGCETTQGPSMEGLTTEAQRRFQQGDFAGALNQQVTPPQGNCVNNQNLSPPPSNETSVFPYEKERPKKTHSKKKNKEICERRAKWANSKGIKTLTVSFEGLGSFNSGLTNRLYDYYDNLWQGKSEEPPRGLGSHVGKNIIGPHMKEDYQKSDFIMLSERGGAKTIEECVSIYKKVIGEEFSLNLMGLSFGAGEAFALAKSLEENKDYGPQGFEVDNLVTIDLRGSERVGGVGPRLLMNGNYQTPTNVKKHTNFGRFDAVEIAYLSPTLGYPGYRSKSSGVPGTSTSNILMPTMSGHARQVKRPEIQNFYKNMIR